MKQFFCNLASWTGVILAVIAVIMTSIAWYLDKPISTSFAWTIAIMWLIAELPDPRWNPFDDKD